MQRQMVGRVVEPDVAKVVVAGLAAVFVSGGLKDWQRNCSADPLLGFAGVNQLGVEPLHQLCHADSLPHHLNRLTGQGLATVAESRRVFNACAAAAMLVTER